MLQYPSVEDFAQAFPVVVSLLEGKVGVAADLHALWVIQGYAQGQIFPDGTAPVALGAFHPALMAKLGPSFTWNQLLQLLMPIIIQILQNLPK